MAITEVVVVWLAVVLDVVVFLVVVLLEVVGFVDAAVDVVGSFEKLNMCPVNNFLSPVCSYFSQMHFHNLSRVKTNFNS